MFNNSIFYKKYFKKHRSKLQLINTIYNRYVLNISVQKNFIIEKKNKSNKIHLKGKKRKRKCDIFIIQKL